MCSEGSKHISFPLFFRDLTTQYPYRTQNYFCSVSRFALRPYPIGLLMECFEYIPPVCIYFVSLLFSSLQIHYRCQGSGVLQHFFSRFFPLKRVRVLSFHFFTCHITFRSLNRGLLLLSRMFVWFRIRTQWHKFHNSCQLFHLYVHTFIPLHTFFAYRK